MDSEVKSYRYRAFNPKSHTYFGIAYGPSNGLPFIAQTIEDLVYHIAYYWWRCDAWLEVSVDDGLTWNNADNDLQACFKKMLDVEFIQYEMH